MALNRFMVKPEHLGKFGQLIKAWARGKTLPLNKEEFIKQLDEYQITVEWPKDAHEIKSVVVERVPLGRLHLMVAPVELINESEAYLQSHPYPLMEYYSTDAFKGAAHEIANNLDFNDKRTGDYTISHCT
jgi:hypothetical protein